jgi:4-hydroxybenzoate polyprenyltransferase
MIALTLVRLMKKLKALFISVRPKQWSKNIVIFAALVFDRQLGFNNPEPLLRTFFGFIIFCLLSGAVYLINDIQDIDADRQHPTKRKRPIAAGVLSVRFASAAVALILLTSIPLSFALSIRFGLVALAYVVLNLAYSLWLKHVTLIDVFSIALGFVLRVAAGVALIQVTRFSPWLYVVTTLASLYIGFGKRRAELALLDKNADAHRRVLSGYTIGLLDQFLVIVSASTILAYSLYTFSAPNLPDNHAMMLTIPFVLYGIFRYLLLVQTKGGGGVPEDVLFSDRPLQVTIILWGLTILLIFYVT